MPIDGDQVTVHYSGRLEDGTEFDSSRGGDPLTFEVGAGKIIPGFESAVRELEVGETTRFRLDPHDAYGERKPELVLEVPAEQAPDGLSEGDQVMLSNGAPATILSIGDQSVTVDANHPLAGRSLIFDVELVAVA